VYVYAYPVCFVLKLRSVHSDESGCAVGIEQDSRYAGAVEGTGSFTRHLIHLRWSLRLTRAFQRVLVTGRVYRCPIGGYSANSVIPTG